MASRKSRPTSFRRGDYPGVATFMVHPWRRLGGYEAEQAAAASISGGDFRSGSRNSSIANMAYSFRTGAEAHAMQVWFESEGDGYDPWDEKLRGWRAAERYERWCFEVTWGLAVDGTWDRIRQSPRLSYRGLRELLRELEPWIVDWGEADRVMGLMPPES